VRGVWRPVQPRRQRSSGCLATSARVFDADPAKGKEQIHGTMQKLAEHNFSLILPWVTSEDLVALDDAEYQENTQTPLEFAGRAHR
jgi:hypothetical protein